jgi:WD40 repeat protein
MGFSAPAQQNSAMMPYRKIKVGYSIEHILYLPSHGGQRIITCSRDASLRVWDLECGTQVGKEWEDNDAGVFAIALSPDGETVVSGSQDGTVKLWNTDTGKVIKKWMGHTERVESVCWSPDGERVVSRSEDDTFRVWDVKSGETIIGPINAKNAHRGRVCYSPDATMIAINGRNLTIWDANTGQLLKTFFLGRSRIAGYLGWTSDGKTLFAGEVKIDTPTWTVDNGRRIYFRIISLSPSDERILASISRSDFTVQLYNFETNQPIGTPLRHEHYVQSGTFSADGKFLVTSCHDDHIYTWDLSAILKEADLQSDIVSSNTFYF